MNKELNTLYFPGEGRAYADECVDRAFEWAVREGLGAVVIFTATGHGPHYAAKELLPRQKYKHLRVVAASPAAGRSFRANPDDPKSVVRAGIPPKLREELTELGIIVISAHLPFSEVNVGTQRATEWGRVAEAYGVLGGGFSLCIQATLIACDAGAIEHGERIVAASADTAIVATACRTESFLSRSEGLLVGHIICRPERYDVSKRKHEAFVPPPQEEEKTGPVLPPVAPVPQLGAGPGQKPGTGA